MKWSQKRIVKHSENVVKRLFKGFVHNDEERSFTLNDAARLADGFGLTHNVLFIQVLQLVLNWPFSSSQFEIYQIVAVYIPRSVFSTRFEANVPVYLHRNLKCQILTNHSVLPITAKITVTSFSITYN